MRFVKMHGLGNDYVYVDASSQKVPDPPALARAVSDRHFGIGADGLILVLPADNGADVRMRMYNADGSEAEMCGNGVRCVAKFAHDHGLSAANPMRIQTAAGVKTLALALDADGKVAAATVDMGEPLLESSRIPVQIAQQQATDVTVRTSSHAFQATCVSMGNPHAVIYVADAAAVPLAEVGPAVENHPLVPRRVNAHFVQIQAADEVTVRHWERGSGATLACGTGAAAVCVAGVVTGRTDREITAHLPGGDMHLEWRQSDNHVYMTGPAVEVFTGEWPG
jgi:diaminopimelate epimerase